MHPLSILSLPRPIVQDSKEIYLVSFAYLGLLILCTSIQRLPLAPFTRLEGSLMANQAFLVFEICHAAVASELWDHVLPVDVFSNTWKHA